ncbi:MAG: UDP-2,3-diacylglucosamine diphosphatase [Epsilonproteobacteria bacterium]|nr:UDP-2,3-diacylglucosamine diphosphatase [Campylobacterota bacterium]
MKLQQYLLSHTFLRDGAIFIADSHYSHYNEDLYYLLLDIKNEKIITNQLFLVGDIFHLLLDFEYLISYNRKVIVLINEIAQKMDVYYFEGNHDFLLQKIFPQAIVVRELNKKGVCINHGDIYVDDWLYTLYTRIIRHKSIMKLAHILSGNIINNWLFKALLKKPVKCEKMKHLNEFVKKKLSFYDKCDIIIEAHYHQNIILDNYVNLPSLYCQKSFLQLENGKFVEKFV